LEFEGDHATDKNATTGAWWPVSYALKRLSDGPKFFSPVIYHGDSDILALQNRGQHDPLAYVEYPDKNRETFDVIAILCPKRSLTVWEHY